MSRGASYSLLRQNSAWLLLLLACCRTLSADIRSSTGNLNFDANADGVAEAALSGSNLGIGTTTPSANLHVLGNAYISNNLGIGTSAPLSSLEVSGTMGFSVQSVSANTTLGGNTTVFADTSSSNLTLTLPYSGNVVGRFYTIKKITNSNNLIVMGTNGYIEDTINKLTLTTGGNSYPYLTVMSTSTTWSILSVSGSDNSVPTTLSDNLVGWWKLDSSSGNTATDSSAQNQNGTLYKFTGSGWNPASGKVQGMLTGNVNSSSGGHYVEVAGNSRYTIGANNFSVACWVKKTVSSSGGPKNAHIVGKYYDQNNPSLNEWSLDISDDNGFGDKPTFRIVNNAVKADGTANLTIGAWTHLVGTRDGDSAIKLYVNGSLITTSGGFSGSIAASSSNLRFFASNSPLSAGAYSSNAELDDVRIYNRALSLAEVQAIYNQGQ